MFLAALSPEPKDGYTSHGMDDLDSRKKFVTVSLLFKVTFNHTYKAFQCTFFRNNGYNLVKLGRNITWMTIIPDKILVTLTLF